MYYFRGLNDIFNSVAKKIPAVCLYVNITDPQQMNPRLFHCALYNILKCCFPREDNSLNTVCALEKTQINSTQSAFTCCS